MNRAIYLPFGDLDRFKRHASLVRGAGFSAVGVDLWGMPVDANATEAVKPYRAVLDECGLACTQTHLPCYDPLVCSTVVDPARESIIRASVSAREHYSRLRFGKCLAWRTRGCVSSPYRHLQGVRLASFL